MIDIAIPIDLFANKKIKKGSKSGWRIRFGKDTNITKKETMEILF